MEKLSSWLKSIIFLFIALILFLSLISFSVHDINLLSTSSGKIHNFIGIAGAYLGFAMFFLFGYGSYFLPVFFLGRALNDLEIIRFSGLGRSKAITALSFIFFMIFLSSFLGLYLSFSPKVFENSGGLSGYFVSSFFVRYLGAKGAFVTLLLFLIVSAILLFGYVFNDLAVYLRRFLGALIEFAILIKEQIGNPKPKTAKRRVRQTKPQRGVDEEDEQEEGYEENDEAEFEDMEEVEPEIKFYKPKPQADLSEERPQRKSRAKIKKEADDETEETESQVEPYDPKTYEIPDPSILRVQPYVESENLEEDIKANIRNLEDTLADFGVIAKVLSVQKGPVVTMYELQPAAGVKITKISALSDDVALAMKSVGVRVVAPLPGRGTVGIEIPNEKKMMVFLREVVEDDIFVNAKSKLSMAIGKDVSGTPVVADLKEMPHLLIAGATGAGKTVCVNSLISSILFNAKPDEVKFILIDPKMVELTPYAGIPHLLHPIICEAKKAVASLNWAVEEMERRYRTLANAGTRNIDGYNAKIGGMPYVIIVIDELADLMIVARDNIEVMLQRLAQLSRAVGIHLILATQRPSVDVITGVIKANFPARISFKVSSKIDSRTVLDSMGAEKLLGKGDLLFLKPGAMKLIRAQGAFIEDEDIETLTAMLREQGGPIYEEGIVKSAQKQKMNVEGDELYDEAVKVVLTAQQASASLIQRRLRVGYSRAARLLDLMEQAGLVGPFCGSKAREILVDPLEYLSENEE